MIIFEVIRWKNLLSTGNAWTEIELNTSKTNLIMGTNGQGKSTILDALCFVLFGSPFRKINKPALINSVNGKDLKVELEFSTYGKKYKILRGMKPNIFEIWCDGTMLNQDSASRDYQEYLEKFILKMNKKSFTQIVILGSATFKPFMQLVPAERRIIIEDLLDIQIFSVMNVLVKQRLQQNREAVDLNNANLKSAKEKKSYVERTLSSLKQNNEDRIDELTIQYEDFKVKRTDLLNKVTKLIEEKENLVLQVADLSDLRNTHATYVVTSTKHQTNVARMQKEIEFFHSSDNCPTCKQVLDQDFKVKRICDLEDSVAKMEKATVDFDKFIGDILEMIREKEQKSKRIQEISAQIKADKQTMLHIMSTMDNIKENLEKVQNADNLVKDSEEELKKVNKEIEKLDASQIDLLEQRQYIDTALALLKDGGIKTKIIKQYIPIINKLVNKYLDRMGFFVNFNVDENFNEVIKSRYRDEFTYDSFSEGEKLRIDLALLLTWRSIAKMKNSVNTNLLIMDEILDRSLDAAGIDEFLKIVFNLTDDTNVFIISPKADPIVDKFDKTYRFQKIRNFSLLQ